MHILFYYFPFFRVPINEDESYIFEMTKNELFNAFFTQESAYYTDKLVKSELGSKYSFNFWAGFLGLIWFCYRKMYLQAIIIFLINIALALIAAALILFFIPDNAFILPYNQALIWILSFFILGFIGNTLYIKKSKKIVVEFISDRKAEDIHITMIKELRKKGGTSLTAAFICAGTMILITILTKLAT